MRWTRRESRARRSGGVNLKWTKAKLVALVKKYQKRLRLEHKTIEVEIVPPDVLTCEFESNGIMADCTQQSDHNMARIRLLDPNKDLKPADRIAYDPEETIVHELQHVVLTPLEALFIEATNKLGEEARRVLRNLWSKQMEQICNQETAAILGRTPRWKN